MNLNDYTNQKKRGFKRKLEMIEFLGVRNNKMARQQNKEITLILYPLVITVKI